jgi:hypothetical protein
MFRKEKECNCDWSAIAYVKTEVNLELSKAIERVRELHKLRVEVNEHGYSNDTCWGCYDEEPSTGKQFHHDYPCPTIKALDGITDEA